MDNVCFRTDFWYHAWFNNCDGYATGLIIRVRLRNKNTMSPIEQKFLEATQRWYQFVGKDHHKDRDCHWFVCVEESWSYGNEPKPHVWAVKHHGYVADDQEFYGDTIEEVLKQAIRFINNFIEKDGDITEE